MLSRISWLLLALALATFAAWYATGTVEVVYAEYYIDEVKYQSKVVCGDAFGVLLFDDYEDVPGPGTALDCRKASRLRAAEIVALGLLVIVSIVGSFIWRYEPPAPIDSELKPLPDMEAERRQSRDS